MLTMEQKIARSLDRKMRQVAHKSPAAQASYRARQEKILREQAASGLTRKHDNAAIAAGELDMILSPFRRALRAGLGK